jgi:hypothetical protein
MFVDTHGIGEGVDRRACGFLGAFREPVLPSP